MIIISLVGIIFLISGLLVKLFPPPKNNVYGYRTSFSMKNENTWKEGNRFASIMMIISGAICIIISILDAYLNNNFFSKSYVALILLSTILPFYTDIHLRRLFDKNGNFKIKK